ncbi:MAG: toxin-antitoxin system YwqK family antitoxin [Flavicella sp.]
MKFALLPLLFYFTVSTHSQPKVNQLDDNGLKTGRWERKYTNGNYRYRGQFEEDKEVGVFYFFTEFNNNHPYLIKEFIKDNPVCSVRFYTREGVLESEGKMKGKLHVGKWLYYGPNGKRVILEENYKNGVFHGPVRIFYRDGSLTEEINYKDGVMHGNSIRYTDLGQLVSKIPYFEGKINGEVFYYDKNGVILENGYYINGKKVGDWKLYLDGVLKKIIQPNKKKERVPISYELMLERRKKRESRRGY